MGLGDQLLAASFVLPVAVVLCRPAAADNKVGINSAVNQQGTGVFPSGPTRQLEIGQDVVFKEQINTQAIGQTQVLFLDESALSIGPDSSMVIDEFVFNPATDSGKLTMDATRGVFRYVGGKISKLEGGVEVKTPVASIGIRGGALLLEVRPDRTRIVFVYGKELVITGYRGRNEILRRPGYAVTITADGAISEPYRAPPEILQSLSAALDGRPNGNGGARQIPTDQRVAISNLGYTVATTPPPSQFIVPCRSITSCSQSTNPGTIQSALQVNTVAVQAAQPRSSPASSPMPTPTPTPVPTPT
ncbi:MAG TPA: FecR domain-containing protein, partial [Stellaceae bacterium]|nr:FecR domain-containing protein [Stellaceae bacterium]